jgi:hypothetical protein
MIATTLLSSLLADVERPFTKEEWYQSAHERFVSGEPEMMKGILTSVMVIVLIVGSAWLLYRWQRRGQRPTPAQPMALYRRVVNKLGFSLVDRWLLWRLARDCAIDHPTALLLSARLYDGAVERYCAGNGLFFARAGKAITFASIRRRLFGEKR